MCWALSLAVALSARAPILPPNAHMLPFARAPHEPFSRQAVVAIALRECGPFSSPMDDDGLSTSAWRIARLNATGRVVTAASIWNVRASIDHCELYRREDLPHAFSACFWPHKSGAGYLSRAQARVGLAEARAWACTEMDRLPPPGRAEAG